MSSSLATVTSQLYLERKASTTGAGLSTSWSATVPSAITGASPSSRAADAAGLRRTLRTLTEDRPVPIQIRSSMYTNHTGATWGRPSARTVANHTFREAARRSMLTCRSVQIVGLSSVADPALWGSAASAAEHRLTIIEGQDNPGAVAAVAANLTLPVDDASAPPEPRRHEPRPTVLHPQTANRSSTRTRQVPPTLERLRAQRTCQRVPDPLAALTTRERILVRRRADVGLDEQPKPRRRYKHRTPDPLGQRRLALASHAPRMPAPILRATQPALGDGQDGPSRSDGRLTQMTASPSPGEKTQRGGGRSTRCE